MAYSLFYAILSIIIYTPYFYPILYSVLTPKSRTVPVIQHMLVTIC